MPSDREELEEGLRLVKQGDWGRAAEVLEPVIRRLERKASGREERSILAEGLRRKAHADARMANLEEAEEELAHSIEISVSLNDDRGLADSYHGLGYVHILKNEVEEAVKNYRRAQDKAKIVKDHELLAKVLIDMGNAHFHMYDFERAKEEYRKAIEILEEKDLGKEQISRAYNNLGEAYKKKGEWEEGIENLRHSIDIARESENIMMEGFSSINVAECFSKMGESDIAKEYLAKGRKLLEIVNDKIGLANGWMILGIVHMEEGEYDQAERAFDKAMVMAQVHEISVLEGEVLVKRGELYIKKGMNERAREDIEKGIDILERNERSRDVEEARKLLEGL